MYSFFDIFNQADPPAIFVCNPNRDRVASIGKIIYDTKLVIRFNALSEFSFKIPKSIDNNITSLDAYTKIQVKRQVYIDQIGYFIINSAIENSDGTVPFMDVSCQSLEAELLSKKLNIFYGTSRLFDNEYDPTNITVSGSDSSLLGYITYLINGIPGEVENGWTVGEISPALLTKYRTFDVSDTTIYSFLMNDVEQAYECVFIFDTINREINVYNLADAVSNTDIYISYDNLIQKSEFSEISDEIATALYVYGGDGLDIRSVNPLGGNVIYDFSYYADEGWMSEDLMEAIEDWDDKLDDYDGDDWPAYGYFVNALLTFYDELAVLESELETLELEYASLEITLKGAIETGGDIVTAKNNLDNQQLLINAKNTQISSIYEPYGKIQEIDWAMREMANINNIVSLNNSANFTQAQRVELSKYIIENTYQNENIIVTDDSTNSEILTTKLDLKEQAINILARVSQPRYEFSVDAVNFLALEEFQAFTNQIPLMLGAQITIDTGSRLIYAVLLEIESSFDKPEDFSLIFSNRLRLDNGKYQYTDLAGQIVKTGSSISFDKPSWANWSSEHKSDVVEFINSTLNATANEIINADGQEIKINASGLRGRQLINPNNYAEGYEPYEVWLTGNTLAFTDSNWTDTERPAKTAIGRLFDSRGETIGYGVVGDYIIGTIIAGQNLTITNEPLGGGIANVTINETGASFYNTKIKIQNSNSIGLIIDPSIPDIFQIGTIAYDTIPAPTFKIKATGDVYMSGEIEAASGIIGGWQIKEHGLYTNNNSTFMKSSGDGPNDIVFQLGTALQVQQDGDALFGGEVYAKNISAEGNKIFSTSGVAPAAGGSTALSANWLYGGTLNFPGGKFHFRGAVAGTGAALETSSGFAIYVNNNPTAIFYQSGLNVQGNMLIVTGSAYKGGVTESNEYATHQWVNDNIQTTGVSSTFSVNGRDGNYNMQFTNGLLKIYNKTNAISGVGYKGVTLLDADGVTTHILYVTSGIVTQLS